MITVSCLKRIFAFTFALFSGYAIAYVQTDSPKANFGEMKRVTFPNKTVVLVGNLYLPQNWPGTDLSLWLSMLLTMVKAVANPAYWKIPRNEQRTVCDRRDISYKFVRSSTVCNSGNRKTGKILQSEF